MTVSRPPDVEFTAAMLVADLAMQRGLGSHGVWAEEAARTGAPLLPWPPAMKGHGRPQLLRILAHTAVEMVMLSMHEAANQESAPTGPEFKARLYGLVQALDPADQDVQIVLRVVNRAVQAADGAMCDRFGGKRGLHRLSGKREFLNWVKSREVDDAVRSGMSRAAALAALPFSRAAAYRAMKSKKKG